MVFRQKSASEALTDMCTVRLPKNMILLILSTETAGKVILKS